MVKRRCSREKLRKRLHHQCYGCFMKQLYQNNYSFPVIKYFIVHTDPFDFEGNDWGYEQVTSEVAKVCNSHR